MNVADRAGSRATHGRPRGLITGASRGIGAAIARALAPTHDLMLGGRDADALASLAKLLPSASPWPVELADHAALAKAVGDIDYLDLLVHSAGVWEPGRIADTRPDTWRLLFEVNVFAVAELTRLLLPALRAARGRVILINSTAAMRVGRDRGAYTASKVALGALADALQAEELHNGVGVTSIYPGRTTTDMQLKVRMHEGGPFRPEEYLAPESVAHAVLAAMQAPADSQLTEIVVTPAIVRTLN
jgi:NADP-dependent 3-hydroxy acid dehydrogenase YdfG